MKYEFDEYLKEKEPAKYYKSYAWKTAIGLQKVDGLEASDYLIKTASRNINGDISFEDAKDLIASYYKENVSHKERTEEADKVSVRIAQIISEKSFVFSPIEYITIHKRLFEGVYSHAGKIRDYNISKEEWVLEGDTVIYGNAINLKETLEYDFGVEKAFSYKGISTEQLITHLSKFIANLWQIHVFGEGNTRTTAVFLIKYLSKLGFSVTNDVFADNAWYFRNALVRANYNNYAKNVFETTHYLELFLRNLLLGEKNELSNRKMHVGYSKASEGQKTICNDKEERIVKQIAQNAQITQTELSLQTGIPLRTVKEIMKNMQQKGKIERKGSKKTGKWEINK